MIIDKKIESTGYLFSIEKGGPGSGNFGHAGIPGQVGGSSSDGGGEDKNGEVRVAGITFQLVHNSQDWGKAPMGGEYSVSIDRLKNNGTMGSSSGGEYKVTGSPGKIELSSGSPDLLGRITPHNAATGFSDTIKPGSIIRINSSIVSNEGKIRSDAMVWARVNSFEKDTSKGKVVITYDELAKK